MIKAPNKMVSNADVREQEYHFAGTGVHAPFSVTASSPEEAAEERDRRIGLVVVTSAYEETSGVFDSGAEAKSE